jgi:hypothetical protein
LPKWTGAVLGALEIAGGAALVALSGGTLAYVGGLLISAGVGTLVAGIGTLLSKGPVNGFATTERNPTAPWKVVYGRQRVGGTIVYVNMWPQPGGGGGGQDQMLDLVIVLAAHAIESVDVLMFDQQRVSIDTTARINTGQSGSGSMSAGPNPNSPYTALGAGVSYTPVQQNVGPGTGGIPKIQRSNGVVTVTLNTNIPYLIEGDRIQVAGIQSPYDTTLNGTYQVVQILVQTTGSLIFTYLCGGANVTVTGQGQINTLWADYGRTVYFEPMLGGQSLGQTFQGMVFGTPLDGNMGDIVSPSHTGGVQGADQPNPWTSDCSLLGKTAVFLRLHYNAAYYKGGLPQISFLVHGKNDILDPRTSTTGYSENAALCIADFLSNTTWGFKAAYGTEIPSANLIAAANTCDEAVPLAYSPSSPPLTEPAYALNGQFDLTMKRGEILQNMLTACGGRLTYVAGQYIIWPAAWVGNSFAIGSNPGGGVISLPAYEQIAAGPLKWSVTQSARELFNGVKGTYVSQANKWQSTDFPPYCQDTMHGYSGPSLYEGDINLAYDGGDRRWLDIQLPFTISYSTAQRLAKIELLRRRTLGGNPRGTGTLILNMVGYQIATLDLITITLPYMGWTEKQFEVSGTRLKLEQGDEQSGTGPRLLVEVDIREVDSSIYDWNVDEELSPQGYVQPIIPGLDTIEFFATETVPGYSIPYPWSPGYLSPLKGDALFPTPIIGGVDDARATFGLQLQYGVDAQGNATAAMDILGNIQPNALSSIDPPQVACVAGTSGSLPPGKYVVAAAAIDAATGALTALGTPHPVTIPAPSPTANSGSIAITVTWPPGSNGGEIYVAPDSPQNGYYFQAALSSSTTTYSFTAFDQATPGAPDATFDHLAVAWKKVIHGGVFAVQVQSCTSNTITLGGPGMTSNQWAGYTLSLLGKLDSTQPLIVLNMPIASSTASGSSSPGTTGQASVTGTFTGNPTNGEAVTIAGKTYTFQSTLTNSDGNVLIGTNAATSLDNLVAAIEVGRGAGTIYAAATTPNQNAYVSGNGPRGTLWFTCSAIVPGLAGNSLAASGSAPISWSNGGSFTGGSSADEFTVTIGANSNGDTLPDLTTMLVEGDLVVMRFKATFGAQSFQDANIANPFYPQGATGVEPGHLAMVLTGADAGDVQTISAVNQDGSGNYTIFELAAPWAIQPATGDIVIIVEAAYGPEVHTQSFSSATRGATSGVVAEPLVTNLAGQTWLFIVRAQDSEDDNGDDAYAPVRECYIFGSRGTRTITASTGMLFTDNIILADCSNGPITFTLLPFSEIPNQTMTFQKIDGTSNALTILCSGSPTADTINGVTSIELTEQWNPFYLTVAGNG